MTRRERRLVAGATTALAVVAGYQFVFRPAAARARTLRRVVAQERDMLDRLTARAADYRRISEGMGRVGGQTGSDAEAFNLLSFAYVFVLLLAIGGWVARGFRADNVERLLQRSAFLTAAGLLVLTEVVSP